MLQRKQQMVQTKQPLVEARCQYCGKLFGMLPKNVPYELKCPRCHKVNVKEKSE